MRKRIAATVCAGALVVAALVPVAVRAGPPPQLPALTRIASALSGLAVRRQVRVDVVSGAVIERHALRLLDREYPPARQAYDERLYRTLGILQPGQQLRPHLVAHHVRGVQGVYDPVARRAYVRRGPNVRRATLTQLVHALQDQAFNLRRMNDLRRGSRDGALAAAAAVQGSASFTTLQGGGGRTPAAAALREPYSHTGVPKIRLFVELQAAFPSTVGARFAASLHELGGRVAVNTALRRFPETTEQVFHIEKFLAREPAKPILLPESAAGFALRADDTFGELDVRALLAVFQVPRLDHAGEGWGGGRTAHYRDAEGRDAIAIVLDWDTPGDAARWAEAFATYVNEAFHADIPGPPPMTPCGAEFCWEVAGRSIAFSRDGTMTSLVFGPTLVTAEALGRELLGQGLTRPG